MSADYTWCKSCLFCKRAAQRSTVAEPNLKEPETFSAVTSYCWNIVAPHQTQIYLFFVFNFCCLYQDSLEKLVFAFPEYPQTPLRRLLLWGYSKCWIPKNNVFFFFSPCPRHHIFQCSYTWLGAMGYVLGRYYLKSFPSPMSTLVSYSESWCLSSNLLNCCFSVVFPVQFKCCCRSWDIYTVVPLSLFIIGK